MSRCRGIAAEAAPTGKSQAKKNPPSFEGGLFGYKAPGGDLLRVLRCAQAKKNPPSFEDGLFGYKAPGGDLLLHGLSHTTIGACAFHF